MRPVRKKQAASTWEDERQKQGFDVSRRLPLMVRDEALENDGDVVWLPGR